MRGRRPPRRRSRRLCVAHTAPPSSSPPLVGGEKGEGSARGSAPRIQSLRSRHGATHARLPARTPPLFPSRKGRRIYLRTVAAKAFAGPFPRPRILRTLPPTSHIPGEDR